MVVVLAQKPDGALHTRTVVVDAASFVGYGL
jgi:hypothetical protein